MQITLEKWLGKKGTHFYSELPANIEMGSEKVSYPVLLCSLKRRPLKKNKHTILLKCHMSIFFYNRELSEGSGISSDESPKVFSPQILSSCFCLRWLTAWRKRRRFLWHRIFCQYCPCGHYRGINLHTESQWYADKSPWILKSSSWSNWAKNWLSFPEMSPGLWQSGCNWSSCVLASRELSLPPLSKRLSVRCSLNDTHTHIHTHTQHSGTCFWLVWDQPNWPGSNHSKGEANVFQVILESSRAVVRTMMTMIDRLG